MFNDIGVFSCIPHRKQSSPNILSHGKFAVHYSYAADSFANWIFRHPGYTERKKEAAVGKMKGLKHLSAHNFMKI